MKLKWTILNNWKENISHYQKLGRGSSKKKQPAGINRGRKMQKLTAVDIGRQYWTP